MRKVVVAAVLALSTGLAPILTADVASAAPTLTPIDTLAFDPPLGNSDVHVVTLPSGQIVVADSRDGSLTEMNADGTNQQTWATGLTGLGGATIYTDPTVKGGGYVYIAHAGNGSNIPGGVYRFNMDGTNETNFYGQYFTDPQDVAVDAAGNLYVADLGSKDVASGVWEVQFDSKGYITSNTEVGSGAFDANASLDAIAYDPSSGDFFVGDQENSVVERLHVHVVAGETVGTVSTFMVAYIPTALAVDGSNLLVSDLELGLYFPQIQSVPLTSGSPTTIATMGEGDYTGINVVPSGTTGLTAGSLFIGQQVEVNNPQNSGSLIGEGQVTSMTSTGANATPIAMSSDPGTARLSGVGYDVYSQQLLVADETLGTIYVMNTDGSSAHALITNWSSSGLDYPTHVAADPATGTLYVVALNGVVREFPNTGGTEDSGTVLSGGSVPGSVTSVAVVGGNLLLGNYQGIWAAPLGTSAFSLWASPGAVSALTVGHDGRVYAAIYDGGVVSYSVLGANPVTSSLPTNATPQSIAVDGTGRIFVADSTNGLDEVSAGSSAAQVLDNTIQYLGVANTSGGDVYSTTSNEVSRLTVPASPWVTSLGTTSGTEGTSFTLTVNGSGFTGATSVDWVSNGSVASSAQPTVVSDAKLTVVVPAYLSPATYDVVVVTPGGSSSIVTADQYTENPGPPNVGEVGPVNGATSGGTSVQIYGQFFSGATAVTFGGQPAASFVVHSPSYITAVTPPALVSGPVDIRVTTSYGTSSVNGFDRFTFTGPIVTSLSPNVGSTAGGKSLTINGSGFSGASQVVIGTTKIKAAAFTSVSNTKIVVKAPAHAAGAVQVVVTTLSGSSPTYTTAGTPNVYTYEGAPTVTALTPHAITHGTTTSIVLKGTGLLGATKVVIGTATAAITANPSATSLTITTPSLAKGTYYVVVTTPVGTSGKVTAAKLTVS